MKSCWPSNPKMHLAFKFLWRKVQLLWKFSSCKSQTQQRFLSAQTQNLFESYVYTTAWKNQLFKHLDSFDATNLALSSTISARMLSETKKKLTNVENFNVSFIFARVHLSFPFETMRSLLSCFCFIPQLLNIVEAKNTLLIIGKLIHLNLFDCRCD